MDNGFQAKCCDRLLELGRKVRQALHRAVSTGRTEHLQQVAHDDGDDDTIYRLDLEAEPLVLQWAEEAAGDLGPIRLVVEGLDDSSGVVPAGTLGEDVRHIVIVDPVDGTRGLMVDKRPAWFLAAVAPATSLDDRGRPTARLRDIVAACMVELPTSKMTLADEFWATADGPRAEARRVNLLNGQVRPLELRPSRARTLEHGFASMVKFFPGGKDVVAQIEERLFERLIGPPRPGRALVFDDQYIASGGQVYELASGHDRMVAALRPLVRGAWPRAAHPYDLCTERVLRKAGCVVVAPDGSPLQGPLDTTTGMAWVGYANRHLFESLHPILLELLEAHPAIELDRSTST